MGPVETWGKTDVGRSRRNNEDAFAIEEASRAAIVADGMGGAACGEVASAITIEQVSAWLRSSGAGPGGDETGEEDLLKEAIRRANEAVYRKSRDERGCHGMGSTVVVARWRRRSLWIANVGDSRAYLWRNGTFRQLSHDQNLANELRVNLGLSDEEISHYPHRHVLTMAIGTTAEIQVRTSRLDLRDGDLVLLCSDGLYGPVKDARLQEILASEMDLDRAGERMIREANEAGGPDNITVVLLRFHVD